MGVKQTNGDDSAGQGGIVWTNEKRRLGDLIPWPRNPRQIKKAEARRLVESVDEFGQVETLAIGPGNDIYNGHQRLNVLMAEHGPEFVVDVRVSSRPLSEKEREKLTVLLHRGATGSWDFDLLANEFDADELIEWGFEVGELGLEGDDVDPASIPVGPPEQTISAELFERHDYIVFYIDNEMDWKYLSNRFDIKTIESAPVGKRTLVQRGQGRLLPASKLIEELSHE